MEPLWFVPVLDQSTYVRTYMHACVYVCTSCMMLFLRVCWLSMCFSVVMVVGAGRGPLVKAALNASRNSQIQIRVYAVEKNPGAVIT